MCDNCGASFSTKGSLNLHRYTRHIEADKHEEKKMKRRKQSAEKKKQGESGGNDREVRKLKKKDTFVGE